MIWCTTVDMIATDLPSTHMVSILVSVVSQAASANISVNETTALPFLVRSELLLSPLLPLFTAYILSLLGFNVAKHVLFVYFGR